MQWFQPQIMDAAGESSDTSALADQEPTTTKLCRWSEHGGLHL